MGQKILDSPEDTIVALATPHGVGGIAVVRVSGPRALSVLKKCWRGKSLDEAASHTAHLGWICEENGENLDQVVAVVFRAPNSYTGEDVVEISCHGSLWIQQALVNRLIDCGARSATGGEFTRRAFMNGRLDLAQAEGVGDMIAASSKAAARLAVAQLKGDFSKKLKELRNRLIDIASLLELELDFSEEDVEFADRHKLIDLSLEVREVVDRLAASYKAGNAFKRGVPVVISGRPNVGKSTLLNALIGEEKAIVSDIPGTTRDLIDDTVEIDSVLFRFFDTAGLRDSDNRIEAIGVDRARKKMEEAAIVLRLVDPSEIIEDEDLSDLASLGHEVPVLYLISKNDVVPEDSVKTLRGNISNKSGVPENMIIDISAKTGKGLDILKGKLVELSTSDFNPEQELIVTNARHYEALTAASKSLSMLLEGLEAGISADFLAQDLREAVHHLGSITGEVSSDDILHTIFARYCIGK